MTPRRRDRPGAGRDLRLRSFAGAASPDPRLLLEAAYLGATDHPEPTQPLGLQAVLLDELPEPLGRNANHRGGLGQKHQLVLHRRGLYPRNHSSAYILHPNLGLL